MLQGLKNFSDKNLMSFGWFVWDMWFFDFWENADFDFVVKDQSMWAFSAEWFSSSVTLNVISWFVWVSEDNDFTAFVVSAQGFWA